MALLSLGLLYSLCFTLSGRTLLPKETRATRTKQSIALEPRLPEPLSREPWLRLTEHRVAR